MGVLIFKNVAHEGPGTIEDHLRGRGMPMKVVELGNGEEPPTIKDYSHLVIMGGPMGVYEADRHPEIRRCVAASAEAVERGIPVLGICLGAQVLAHALGSGVYKGPAEETGWLDVEITDEGMEDPVFSVLSGGGGDRAVKVFQWHGDTFELPPGAVRLAGSGLYVNQAFRFGPAAYGLQFHIEATADMIGLWFRGRQDEAAVLEDTRKFEPQCRRRALGFYDKFFS